MIMLLILRAILMAIYFILVSLFGSLYCLFRPFHPDNTALFGRLFSWGGHRILGISVNVKGLEVFDGMGPCVIVANHQSNMDLFTFGHVVPRRGVSVGKKSLRYIPLFGQLYWLSGNIMIDRGNPRKARESLEITRRAIKEKQMKIWVFPEGTRNGGKNLLPFKQGAFRMAIDAEVPIVPVCVNSYLQTLTLNKWHGGSIRIEVLAPVSTAGKTMRDLDSLVKIVHTQMQGCIDSLDRSQGSVGSA
jgi:1-acyl-sn-glycerol-3-phosphate acyltransferase